MRVWVQLVFAAQPNYSPQLPATDKPLACKVVRPTEPANAAPAAWRGRISLTPQRQGDEINHPEVRGHRSGSRTRHQDRV